MDNITIQTSSEKDESSEDKKSNEMDFENTSIMTEKFAKELKCAICRELFVKAQTLNCSHSFCKNCIEQWGEKNNRCPICRVEIETMTPTNVLDNFVDVVVETLSEENKNYRKTLLEERSTQCVPQKGQTQFKRDAGVVRRAVLVPSVYNSRRTNVRNLTPTTRRILSAHFMDGGSECNIHSESNMLDLHRNTNQNRKWNFYTQLFR
nr:E3 ubiquitin-protein ligase rnf8-like [Onthophagus taurus]